MRLRILSPSALALFCVRSISSIIVKLGDWCLMSDGMLKESTDLLCTFVSLKMKKLDLGLSACNILLCPSARADVIKIIRVHVLFYLGYGTEYIFQFLAARRESSFVVGILLIFGRKR
jgi:hypothetical protein